MNDDPNKSVTEAPLKTVAIKTKSVKRMTILYIVFFILSIAGIATSFLFPMGDSFAMMDKFFIFIWILGFFYCLNGTMRGAKMLKSKSAALVADEDGLTIACYLDYPKIKLKWSNIIRAVCIDNTAFLELRRPDEVTDSLSGLDALIFKFVGVMSGSMKLLCNGYNGVKNGTTAAAIRPQMIDATADEIVTLVNSALREYKRREQEQ